MRKQTPLLILLLSSFSLTLGACRFEIPSFPTSSSSDITSISTSSSSSSSTSSSSSSEVHPSRITISSQEKTVYINDTFDLDIQIVPSTTTNKKINWTVSDNAIMSYASKNENNTSITVTALAKGNGTITATSEDRNLTATCDVTIKEKGAQAAWTILLYMCGSDLESESYLATGDLEEIKSVVGQPDDVNFVIEAGGASKWSSTFSSVINKSYLNRFHLSNRTFVKDAQIARASMGESSTLQSFIEWGLNTYPADKVGLILWNHGGGMRGVCYDENYSSNSLLNTEVVKAVSNAKKNLNIENKFEFIGYDACLMGVQDVAEFNSPYFNYMVSSQESENGYGWDYDTWVDDLFANKPTTTILQAIADGFIADNGGVNATGGNYDDGYGNIEYYPADQTMSVYDLSQMAAYLDAFETMAAQLKNKITSSNSSTFNKQIIGKTKYFGSSDYDYFCTFDVYHFLTLLSANTTFNPGSTYINNVKTAFNKLVIYNITQKEAASDAHGLCLYYVAGTGYNQSTYSSSTYTNFTNWAYLSKTYGRAITSSYSY